jgi:hypothetical protein
MALTHRESKDEQHSNLLGQLYQLAHNAAHDGDQLRTRLRELYEASGRRNTPMPTSLRQVPTFLKDRAPATTSSAPPIKEVHPRLSAPPLSQGSNNQPGANTTAQTAHSTQRKRRRDRDASEEVRPAGVDLLTTNKRNNKPRTEPATPPGPSTKSLRPSTSVPPAHIQVHSRSKTPPSLESQKGAKSSVQAQRPSARAVQIFRAQTGRRTAALMLQRAEAEVEVARGKERTAMVDFTKTALQRSQARLAVSEADLEVAKARGEVARWVKKEWEAKNGVGTLGR